MEYSAPNHPNDRDVANDLVCDQPKLVSDGRSCERIIVCMCPNIDFVNSCLTLTCYIAPVCSEIHSFSLSILACFSFLIFSSSPIMPWFQRAFHALVFTMSMADRDVKVSSPDVRTETDSMASKTNDYGIVLVPQPSDDPEDPLVREKKAIYE